MPISHRHTFNKYPEYVSPLPAEDLIMAGKIKQANYDEGVQKMDTYLSTLDEAGLSFVRDVDKQYFTQEMDKMVKAINESAGKVDFSNKSDVRKLLSVGKPLESDPFIINALQSSAEFHRRQEVLSKLKPEERSPANDWLFTQDMEQWYQSKNPGESLQQGKAYVPFVDPSEHVQDYVAKMTPSITMDIVKSKDGKYLSEAQVKQLTAQRIREGLMEALPQNIKDQIAIDAQYSVSGVPQSELLKHYLTTRSSLLVGLQEQLSNFEAVKKIRGLSPEEEQEYESQRNKFQVLHDLHEQVLQNPTTPYLKEAITQEYFNDFISGQAKLYSYRQEAKKITADPYSILNTRFSQDMAKEKQQFEYQQKLEEIRHGYRMEEIEERGENSLDVAKLKNMTAQQKELYKQSVREQKVFDKEWEDTKLYLPEGSKKEASVVYEKFPASLKVAVDRILNDKGITTNDDQDRIEYQRVIGGNGKETIVVWDTNGLDKKIGEISMDSVIPSLPDFSTQNFNNDSYDNYLPWKSSQEGTSSSERETIKSAYPNLSDEQIDEIMGTNSSGFPDQP